MRRIISFLLLLNCGLLLAQESSKITITLENATVEQALLTIEETTDIKFFYVEQWVNQGNISINLKDVPVEDALQQILSETLLNFYRLDKNQIVITRNNIVYDELPQGFFPKKDSLPPKIKKEIATKYNPVFYSQEDRPNSEIQTVYIGKEDKTSGTGTFTLSGLVKDLETGKPISNLAVLIKGTDIGTVTNQQGFYSLKIPAGVHILQTRSLGSEDITRRLVIYNNGNLNLDLREDYELLGEILLESDPDENVSNSIAGEEKIDIEEIKNIPLILGERDVMKVAATLPGISTAGEGAAGFNVRGGKTDQNLILLDDAVIYNPAHFFGIFSAINPFTTGDMTIYKGSIPAQYGGRLSSVFDITSKDANTKEFAGEVSVGPVTGNVALEIPIIKEKSGLLLGGRSTYSGWILQTLEEESLKNSKASFYDVLAKYNHKINDKTSIKTTGYFSHDHFSITSDSLYSYENLLFSVRADHKINEKNEASLILSNSNYKFNIDYESELNNNFSSGYTINETEAKLNMRYLLNDAHKFDYGISGKLYNVHPGELKPLGSESNVEPFTIPGEKGLESAVFISDNYEVNDRLLINAGVRYSLYAALGEKAQKIYEDDLPKNDDTVIDTLYFGKNEVMDTYGGPEVRFSARYFIMPDLSTKLSYNSTYQYIHTLSNNTTVSPTDTYKLTDRYVRPQQANQYSLGLYKNFDNNEYELSLEGYYKTSKNILDYKVGAQLFLNESIETEVLQGNGRSYGLEFLMKKTEGRLNGWLGYTYSRSYIQLDGEHREEVVNNGEYFPSNYDKPHDLSVVANYKVTQRFSFSANFVYQTGRPVTYPTGKYVQNGMEYVLYSNRNQFRIPDYYRLDLSFNVEGNHKIEKFAHSFWNISIYNVLGRNNPYSVFFVTDQGEIKAYKSSIFSIPVPTITYNFKF
ncbi:TonB-dependent receptor [Salinimicrobium sp. TH3]|uniref:TonB-dependent receptor n=1 Tax=Salinimicrobium sp. TH3 TaxID=2997342 RepID=UPI002273E0CC|nr:TonB-dependent receptor [Salinimicrobium sp. TH3]MCY2688328.1 TonB-dependent receptor [Salinimicrobium sp. TH3]